MSDKTTLYTDPGVHDLARLLAWVDRANHDVSEDSEELWSHLVEDTRERYRAMARQAIVWVEDCHGR